MLWGGSICVVEHLTTPARTSADSCRDTVRTAGKKKHKGLLFAMTESQQHAAAVAKEQRQRLANVKPNMASQEAWVRSAQEYPEHCCVPAATSTPVIAISKGVLAQMKSNSQLPPRRKTWSVAPKGMAKKDRQASLNLPAPSTQNSKEPEPAPAPEPLPTEQEMRAFFPQTRVRARKAPRKSKSDSGLAGASPINHQSSASAAATAGGDHQDNNQSGALPAPGDTAAPNDTERRMCGARRSRTSDALPQLPTSALPHAMTPSAQVGAAPQRGRKSSRDSSTLSLPSPRLPSSVCAVAPSASRQQQQLVAAHAISLPAISGIGGSAMAITTRVK